MKIKRIEAFPVWVGFRNQFVVKVETDNGLVGLGEGGMSYRELAMKGMIEHLREFLIGQDPRRIEHHWQVMYRAAYFEGGNTLSAAISAIDMACWDILGKSLGVPVYQLLGGATRDTVPCFATPGHLGDPNCVEQAKEFAGKGWRFLRFGIGSPPGTPPNVFEPMEAIDMAAEQIREIRRAVGPAVGLSIDFHHRLSVAEAALFCQKIADVHLMFLEEPIRSESPEAYAQLRKLTPMPFAIGEEFSSKWRFVPFVEQGLMEFCRLDLSNVGGFTEAKKIAGWCEAHYVDLMPHNPLGPICTAASVHFGAAVNNFAQLEYRHEIEAATPSDLFPKFPRIEGTSFPLPTEPGLGVEFDETKVEEHPFAFAEAPHLTRRDGQYTNW